jgi:hypothetical protein
VFDSALSSWKLRSNRCLVKFGFELVTHFQTFDFPKLFTYGCFS